MTLKTAMKSSAKSLLLAVLAVVLGLSTGLSASAQVSREDAPAITMFYPDNYEPAQVLKTTAGSKLYVYFSYGSKINSCKGRVMQNGTELGLISYGPTSTTKLSNTVMALVADVAAFKSLTPGLFDIEIYEVSFLSGEETLVYSDVNNPLGTVTYQFNGENGKVVSESSIPGNTIKSYYPAGSSQGLKTYTFSKAVKPDNILTYFEYGLGDDVYYINLPHTLSNDGLVLTIDMRGVCHGAAVMTNNHTFVDEQGNEVENPTTINIKVDNLNCVDGTKIETVTTSPDGRYTITQEGKIHQTYSYQDLTFETPVISSAQFYASSNPDTKYNTLDFSTDMMTFYVSNATVISSADVKFTYAGQTIVVPDAQVTKQGGYYTLAVPEVLLTVTADQIEFTLDNVVYAEEDGAEHVINVYQLSNVTKEVRSIADLYNLDVNASVIVNIPEGFKVTYANEQGYCFAEDSTGGIQLAALWGTKLFDEGSLVKGQIKAKYLGYGILSLNLDKSEYTVGQVSVYRGAEASVADIQAGNVTSRLVTIPVTAETTVTYDEEVGCVLINGEFPVIVDFIEDFAMPAAMNSITGVVYYDMSAEQYYLIARSMDDFDQEEVDTTPVISTLAEALAYEPYTDLVIAADGVKITFSQDYNTIIDDGTAGMIAFADDDSFLGEMGDALTGTIRVTYMGENMMMVNVAESAYTVGTADVSTGVTIGLDTIADESNYYRLVTFDNTEETPFTVDTYNGITIGNAVAGVDFFWVLDNDYEFPQNVKQFTGIIVPNNIGMYDNLYDDDEPAARPVLVALRGTFDVVEGEDTVGDVDGDGKVDVNDLGSLVNIVCAISEGTPGADVNNDGSVDITDIGILINMICGM